MRQVLYIAECTWVPWHVLTPYHPLQNKAAEGQNCAVKVIQEDKELTKQMVHKLTALSSTEGNMDRQNRLCNLNQMATLAALPRGHNIHAAAGRKLWACHAFLRDRSGRRSQQQLFILL